MYAGYGKSKQFYNMVTAADMYFFVGDNIFLLLFTKSMWKVNSWFYKSNYKRCFYIVTNIDVFFYIYAITDFQSIL